jgi:hypothetical protein
MDVSALTRDDVRDILRASEGIRSQLFVARLANGRVSPPPVGHPITNHLHSAGLVDDKDKTKRPKTKFRSMDDMVDALLATLRSPSNVVRLRDLKAGGRATVAADVFRLFDLEGEVPDPQGRPANVKVKFSPEELRRMGRTTTACIAVVEVRERAGVEHLQIHSFYPKVSQEEMSKMLLAIRSESLR